MRGPIAQSAVELVRLVGSKIVGYETAPAGRQSRAARKGSGAAETARANKEIMVGSAVVGSIVALIVALFLLEASGGTGGPTPQRIQALPLSNAEPIRAALFGAMPYVIECTSPPASGRSLLQEAAAGALIPDDVVAVSLACDQPIGSSPSLLDRFKLKSDGLSAPPLLLKSGNGLTAPLPLSRQPSVPSLVRHLKLWSQPHITLLNSTLDLRRHCLSRPVCLLLITRGTAPTAARKTILKAVGSTGTRHLGTATLNRKTHTAVSDSLDRLYAACLLPFRPCAFPLLLSSLPGQASDVSRFSCKLMLAFDARIGSHSRPKSRRPAAQCSSPCVPLKTMGRS